MKGILLSKQNSEISFMAIELIKKQSSEDSAKSTSLNEEKFKIREGFFLLRFV